MLQPITIARPSERLKLLETFDPKQQKWVVSDLKSKFETQEILLQNVRVLEGSSVQRASELWISLLEEVRPDMRVLSGELMELFVKEYLSTLEYEWADQPGAANTLISYINELLPFLAHSHGPELLAEWFEAHPNSFSRWGDWALEGLKLWRAAEEKNITAMSWVPAVLLQEDLSSVTISQALFFDLGIDLRPTELELIEKLSEITDTKLIVPSPSWDKEDLQELDVYASYLDKKSNSSVQPKVTAKRFSSMLAEVKDCMAQVRHWLADGVPLHQISLLAPDIGIYWPVLREYLDTEDWEHDRTETALVSSFPSVARWLGYLRSLSKQVNSGDLELAFFGDEDRDLTYNKFKTLYARVFDPEDLNRHPSVTDFFNLEKARESETYDVSAFTSLLLLAWLKVNGNSNVETLETVVKGFYESVKADFHVTFLRWFEALEKYAFRKEVTITPSKSGGLRVGDLNSSDNFTTSHIYCLGASDQGLRTFKMSSLSLQDASSLTSIIGSPIRGPESTSNEFLLNWVLEDEHSQVVLSFPEADFLGTPLTPSLVWLRFAKDGKSDVRDLDLPGANFWDSISKSGWRHFQKLDRWRDRDVKVVMENIEKDVGKADFTPPKLDFTPTLSASSLEHYVKCPFIFFATRALKLRDVALLDMDMEPRVKGRLIHALFAELGARVGETITDSDIDEVIEDCRKSEKIEVADQELWEQEKAKLVKLGRKFLRFEEEWQVTYPESQILYREVPFSIYWNPEIQSLSLKDEKESFQINGRIDRVDKVADSSVVIDYKSSLNKSSQHQSWIEKGELQLGLYSLLVKEGFLEDAPEDVIGAVYFDMKTFRRDVGYLCQEEDGRAFSVSKRQKHGTDRENRDRFLEQMKDEISKIISEISTHAYHPKPKDEKDCPSCEWRGLCRAPHLN